MTTGSSIASGSSAHQPRLRLGSAPDSWGVWFPDDPQQVPWPRFLDEFKQAGYEWLELGPYGYLPTDAGRLREELDRRGIRVAGGDVAGGLHRAGAWESVVAATRPAAELTKALGGRYLVFIPDMFRNLDSGEYEEPVELEPEQWRNLVTGVTRLGKLVADEYGLDLVFHNHADSHVGSQQQTVRFLEDTDPKTVFLCLDTGHLSYYDGDNLAIVDRYAERIGCLHIKQVDPAVLREARSEDLSFAQAVRRRVMCEPPGGLPELPPIMAALASVRPDIFAIVEQDLYPCDPDLPLAIAKRTREYLSGR